MSEDMREIRQLGKRPRRKWLDFLIGVVLLVIIIFLGDSLLGQLNLKHEVKDAKAVSNQMINDIRKQDGNTARALGDKTFQSQNSASNLTSQFKSASKLTASTPSVDHQTVTNDKTGQHVSIIYKFPKPAFYIRIIVVKANGSDKFQVVNLSANTNEKPLLDNKY